MRSDTPADPLVSILVLSFNSAETILETLDSIKSQTYRNAEIIISDDASSDSTIALCKSWIQENANIFARMLLIRSDVNTGIPANMNRAIKNSRGDWIKAVAADDVLSPECLESYIRFISQEPEAKVLFSDVFFCDENSRVFAHDSRTYLEGTKFAGKLTTAKEQFEILLRTNPIRSGLSFFIQKDLLYQVGLYDEDLRLWEDRPMLLKLTLAGFKLHYVPIISGKYRIHPKSAQRSNFGQRGFKSFKKEKFRYYRKHYLHHLAPADRLVTMILLYLELICPIAVSDGWVKIRKKLKCRIQNTGPGPAGTG